jgi:hypothetical protein
MIHSCEEWEKKSKEGKRGASEKRRRETKSDTEMTHDSDAWPGEVRKGK